MNTQPIPLGRSILGMFAGYVLSVVLLMLLVGLCYIELGSEGVFVANSYRDTSLIEILKLACGCVAAIAAGWLAVRIGAHGGHGPCEWLDLMEQTGVAKGALA